MGPCLSEKLTGIPISRMRIIFRSCLIIFCPVVVLCAVSGFEGCYISLVGNRSSYPYCLKGLQSA
jgi:hypothetical protein